MSVYKQTIRKNCTGWSDSLRFKDFCRCLWKSKPFPWHYHMFADYHYCLFHFLFNTNSTARNNIPVLRWWQSTPPRDGGKTLSLCTQAALGMFPSGSLSAIGPDYSQCACMQKWVTSHPHSCVLPKYTLSKKPRFSQNSRPSSKNSKIQGISRFTDQWHTNSLKNCYRFMSSPLSTDCLCILVHLHNRGIQEWMDTS